VIKLRYTDTENAIDVSKEPGAGGSRLLSWLLRRPEISRIAVESQPRRIVHKPLSRITLSQKIGLVEWLKVKALSSSPHTTKKKKKRKKEKVSN
jgi:hypothetical protein